MNDSLRETLMPIAPLNDRLILIAIATDQTLDAVAKDAADALDDLGKRADQRLRSRHEWTKAMLRSNEVDMRIATDPKGHERIQRMVLDYGLSADAALIAWRLLDGR